MKTMFILAPLALAATTAIVQLETTCSQGFGQCQQQQQQQQQPGQQQQQLQQQMSLCVVFLQQQCSPMTMSFARSQMMQQLVQIPKQFRCQAIHIVAQAIMQQQPQQQGQGMYQPQQQAQLEIMRKQLQTLPSMCSVYVPAYCTTITPAPYSIPMAAACAGGAC